MKVLPSNISIGSAGIQILVIITYCDLEVFPLNPSLGWSWMQILSVRRNPSAHAHSCLLWMVMVGTNLLCLPIRTTS